MKTAVDTSVLIAIAKGEGDVENWVKVLAQAQVDGDLVINEVAAAEYYALLPDDDKFNRTLRDLGIVYEAISVASARLAGRLFRQYRDEGGPRNHLVPDFLIGAHALGQADRIAAKDRGYLRRYFPKLTIVSPAGARLKGR